ncbi:adenylate/guanylate cyclase domain-containing protein [Inquilinus sp. Marseille-Q2685]|uniref:adenylate/guanylate cyclase domain-containing protein n=1 Tax=Inquilinus sp. Marseille-Q2685 TaxID=2866581 RepID=UPI001CE49F9C|nr:adenylate/guanylate cyclase domain-containing protein [Inquilinus sp. Marseille-Q2685]
MSWSRERSLERIEKARASVPQHTVDVRTLDANFIRDRRAEASVLKAGGGREQDPIFSVRPSEAVLVDGVHVYIQLLDFANAMLEQGRETEAGHSRALGMLHLDYSVSDRIAEHFEAQRVDYHGSRMHAVIVTPAGPEGRRERALKALAFADALKRTVEEASSASSGLQNYATRVRIGLDSGLAVAVNSGRGSEPEPLFLGNPANYAAKLADGDQPGIFASDRVRAEAGLPLLRSGLLDEKLDPLSVVRLGQLGGGLSVPNVYALTDLEVRSAAADARQALRSAPVFTYRQFTPPLAPLLFDELSPSRSIRMPLASIFADIDGFTAYVSRCIAEQRTREMVANLHVIRKEMAAVLRADFQGRKVRFIGDCLHGLVAEGTAYEVDEASTVKSAVHAAAGLRSSFDLCREVLPGIGELGLAIGIELGTTPITRLGLRGARSVRCAVSKAVSASERLQSLLDGRQTALGPRALAKTNTEVRRLFDDSGAASGLDYAVATRLQAPAIRRSPLTEGLVGSTAEANAAPPVNKGGSNTFG